MFVHCTGPLISICLQLRSFSGFSVYTLHMQYKHQHCTLYTQEGGRETYAVKHIWFCLFFQVFITFFSLMEEHPSGVDERPDGDGTSENGWMSWWKKKCNQDSNSDDANLEIPIVENNRGRPKNTSGSHSVRASIARFLQQKEEERQEHQLDEQPQAGSIEYARSFIKRSGAMNKQLGVPEPVLALGPESIFTKVGSVSQRSLCMAFVKAKAKSLGCEDELLAHHLSGVSTTIPLSKLAAMTGDSGKVAASLLLDAGAAVCEIGSWLWGLLLASVKLQLQIPKQVANSKAAFRPLMMLLQFRYDETPSKVRVSTADGQSLLLPKAYTTQTSHSGCSELLKDLGMSHKQLVENSRQAKVMQTEFHIGYLLEVISDTGADPEFLWCHGEVPVSLAVMDRCTGENERAILWDAVSSVPEISSFWDMFEMRIRHSTTDLYGANSRAESGLQDEGFLPTFTDFHLACDVHRLATAIGASNSNAESDVSGLLAAALAVSDIGNAKAMREILFNIIQDEMEIVYAVPESDSSLDEYRSEVFSLFLPVRAQPASVQRLNIKRQFLLRTLMNGDIRSPTIKHFCPYGCCSNSAETYRNFAVFCTWALLPHQLPIYSRKSWVNYDKAIDAAAILDSHHGLFVRMMERYIGKPSVPPSQLGDPDRGCAPLMNVASDMLVPAALAQSSWENFGRCKVRQASQHQQPGQNRTQEFSNAAAAEGGDASAAGGGGDPGVGMDAGDWHEIKRSRKKKAAAWVQTRPYKRLTVMKEVLSPVLLLMGTFLRITSKKWLKRQQHKCLSGKQPMFVILEAAKGEQVSQCLVNVLTVLHSNVKGVMGYDVTAPLRSLRFRLAGSVMCAIHAVLQHRRRGLPYQLFQLLDGKVDIVCNFPECMWDSLTKTIRQQFPTRDALQSAQCLAVLQALASCAHVDVAAIECKHSSTREHTLLRTRGWFPSFESIAAKAMFRFSKLSGTDADTGSHPKKKLRVIKRRGGGGAWRAFVHEKLRGRKLTKEVATQLSNEYKSLAEPEMLRYQRAGELATYSHKKGYKAFSSSGLKMADSLQLPPAVGSETDSGAIVAADAPQFLVPYTGDTLLERYVSMKKSLPKPHDPFTLSKEEEQELNTFCSNTTGLPLVANLERSGFGALGSGFKQEASSLPVLKGASWQPPLASIVQVLCPKSVSLFFVWDLLMTCECLQT